MIRDDKKPFPGTNPDWDRLLPEGRANSLVDSNGFPYDNGYNFDESDGGDDDDEEDKDKDGGNK